MSAKYICFHSNTMMDISTVTGWKREWYTQIWYNIG